MPIRIIRTPDDPANMLRAEYYPDRRDQRARPQGNYETDASGHITVRARAARSIEPQEREFMVGLDLAQSNDWTALAVVERLRTGYSVPMLTRTRGAPYPQIVGRVADLLETPPLKGQAELVIDATGVGRPVLDLFRASGIDARAITITAGQKPTGSLRFAKVPKRDLINSVLLALQAGTLTIAQDQPHAATLAHELAELRVKITASGYDRYEARDGEHDDLVLSVALGIWSLEKSPSRLR
jgi:hypothetical protein